jgi:O-antigen ligase
MWPLEARTLYPRRYRRSGAGRAPASFAGAALAGVAALGLATAVGAALAFHPLAGAALALVPLAALALGSTSAALTRVPFSARLVALAWLTLVCSTFVWRLRTTSQLNAAPLDSAAGVRVALVAIGGLLAFAALSASRRPIRLPLPLALLASYTAVSVVSALASPLPHTTQALYRSFELAVGVGAVVATLAVLGPRAGSSMLRLTVVLIAAIVSVVWVEAFLVPSRGWFAGPGPLSYTLQGFLPRFESNTVGMLGGLLAVWGLATIISRQRRVVWLAGAALVGGLATLAATQYRTGVLGFLVAATVVLWYGRRLWLTTLATAAVVGLSLFGVAGEVGAQAEETFSKGQPPEVVHTLNSRTLYWAAATPLIEERPTLGWGLNIGSREALTSIGNEGASTIANTWLEALVGTGVLGGTLLGLALLATVIRAWPRRREPHGLMVLGMLVFLVVRSLTGTTFELFGIGFLVFAALALAAGEGARPEAEPQTAAPRDRHPGLVRGRLHVGAR